MELNPSISVTIITLNEQESISRAIKSVAWANEVIVVDAGSTDQTVEIAKALGAKVIHHPWTGYGQQKNFAHQQATSNWILNIDADEAVSEDLAQELRQAIQQVENGKLEAQGFYFPRKNFFLGRWIQHGGWYPNHLVRLSSRKHGIWTEPNVHEELRVEGKLVGLSKPLLHYGFKNIQDQILTNLRFSQLGSEDLKRRGQGAHLGRLILKPLGKFMETYFLKRGFLDGLPGFIISVNAAHSMFLKYAYLTEEKLRENPDC